MKVSEATKSVIRKYPKNEITEYYIYRRLAKIIKGSENKKILEQIADDEMRHYKQWHSCTYADVNPNMFKVWWYYFISIIFGFTLAFQNTRLVALTGLITGIAAALSMGASEYISTKTEDSFKNPLKASAYTTAAYIVAVIILILPFLTFKNSYFCLSLTLAAAVFIIAFFNYYISVAKEVGFKTRFIDMSGLSLGVAGISFLVGYLLRATLGVEV